MWLRDTWPGWGIDGTGCVKGYWIGWGIDGVQGVVKGYWIGWVIVGWRVWALWGVQLGNGEYE